MSDTYLTGQPYTFNTAFQYRLGKMLWPELEVNMTGYKGGPSDGKKQTFLTPGLFVGRIPLIETWDSHLESGCRSPQQDITPITTASYSLFAFPSSHRARGKRQVPHRSKESCGQSVSIKLHPATQNGRHSSNRPARCSCQQFEMRVEFPTDRSLICEINTAKSGKNWELMQLPEWHITCTEVYRRRRKKSMRTLHPSRHRLIADKNFCLDSMPH